MDIRKQYPELVEALTAQAHKFYSLRYQMSNGGNLSCRVPGHDLMIVKGTDVDFSSVGYDTLVVTDFDGHLLEGEIKPSKESLLHGAIYKALPKAGAIMHCHSPYATALAAELEELEFSTHHAEIKLGGCCPVFDTHSYAVPPEYFPLIIGRLLQQPSLNSFLLRKHGQVTIGANIEKAAHLAELVEETAQIAILQRAFRQQA